MLSKLFDPSATGKYHLPVGMYYACRSAWALRALFLQMSRLETLSLRSRLASVTVDRPIYVVGIARGGTTITLELLSRHPEVATHLYRDMPCPFLPWWFGLLTTHVDFGMTDRVERIHLDGIHVDRNSPEMVEEAIWKAFFQGLHDETRSNVLDATVENPAFERFYAENIRKLIMRQGRGRYATKNNNNLTRLEYLHRVFPDLRILLVVRDPVSHVASLVKQNRMFKAMGSQDPRHEKLLHVVGHHEFGLQLSCINAGDSGVVREIRRLWASGEEVRGWALYWDSLYRHAADRLETNPALAESTFMIRYGDLCSRSAETIDHILDHTGLEADSFGALREEYVRKLQRPTYYDPGFSPAELRDIESVTAETAGRLGVPVGP